MKVTLNEVRSLNAGINAIMERELPPPTANKFNKLIIKFIDKIKATENTRVKLALKYAKKDDEGKPLYKRNKKGKRLANEYDLSKENLIKMGVEWDKLNQEEIDFPFEPLPATKEVFGETITADILYKLGRLIEK